MKTKSIIITKKAHYCAHWPSKKSVHIASDIADRLIADKCAIAHTPAEPVKTPKTIPARKLPDRSNIRRRRKPIAPLPPKYTRKTEND